MRSESYHWQAYLEAELQKRQEVEVQLGRMTEDIELLRDENHRLDTKVGNSMSVINSLRARLNLSSEAADRMLKFAQRFSSVMKEPLSTSPHSEAVDS